MWQRFTELARKVIYYAQEEAQQEGHGYVSTEHLLLGLIRETDNDGSKVLAKMGVKIERIRPRIVELSKPEERKKAEGMTLTPRAKRVIDLAYDEARKLSNNYIGTEHLLLGLIREGDGLAGKVLFELGAELEVARRTVMELQEERKDAIDSDKPPAQAAQPERRPVGYLPRIDLTKAMLFELRRGGHLLELTAAASLEKGSAGAALLDEIGVERANVALALELQAERKGMPQAFGIDDLFATAEGFVAEGKTLNTAHLLTAVAAQGCPMLDAALGDNSDQVKAKVAEGKF